MREGLVSFYTLGQKYKASLIIRLSTQAEIWIHVVTTCTLLLRQDDKSIFVVLGFGTQRVLEVRCRGLRDIIVLLVRRNL